MLFRNERDAQLNGPGKIMDQKDRGRISCEMRCGGVDHINPRGGWSNKDWNGLQVVADQTDRGLLFAFGAFQPGALGVLPELARAGCYITSAIKCKTTAGPDGYFGSSCPRRWIDTSIPTVIICRNHLVENYVVDAFLSAGKRGYRISGNNSVKCLHGERSYDYMVICPYPKSSNEVLAWAEFIMGWRDVRKG